MHTVTAFKGNRKYKDRLFRLLFSDKQSLLELYNALNKSNHKNPDDLEITTLNDVLFMKMKNDVSILLDDYLNLYEHQSTVCPNMPLRGLLYFCDLYRQLIGVKHLYSTKLVKIPTPVYIVFYNGNEDIGEEKILRLSDAFTNGNKQSKMELEVRMLNINYGHNRELMENCKVLREYSIFISRIKEYVQDDSLETAIEKAVDQCIEEDVLRDFLIKRRSEVTNSLLTEYDEEQVLADLSREFYEDGEAAGLQKGLQEGAEKILKEKIAKKLEKGKTEIQIAEELEEPLSRIQELLKKTDNKG
ncbi:MAG: hypothetical protein KH828_08325 [Clostridiales bacterium]|nr:hypothetical protein [Clostridiales bacterium]